MRYAFAIVFVALIAGDVVAQPPYNGNTLITPLRSTETFLIDIDQNTLTSWHGDNGAGHTVYLLPDGSVIRSQGDPNGQISGGGGAGGHLQRIDSNDNVVWDYFFSTSEHQQHHDIEPMPNGNLLIIAWEKKTPAEAFADGRTAPLTGDLLPTLIAELEPVGNNDANIVWEWRIWDHIVQDVDPLLPNYGVLADNPGRVDVNQRGSGSWDHANFVDYNAQLDLVLFSSRGMNEVYVIDHSTTTAEAAGNTGGNYGKGGDILYRWGNPQIYGRGNANDQVFWGVHGANWIEPLLPGAGGILAFNNGNREGSTNDRSSVVEIHPPMDSNGNFILDPGQPYGPAVPEWEYEEGTSFFSLRFGSAFRMPNGNTLVCEGVDGNIFEINPDGTKVWVYIEPIGRGVFSAQRHWGPVDVAGALDIYPTTCPNLFNTVWLENLNNGNGNPKPKKGGVMPAAVIGSDVLDVTFIDVATLRLQGVEPLRSSLEDVASPDDGSECGCTTAGPDGTMDLTLKFSRQEIAGVLSSTGDGDVVSLTLTGELLDGTPFEATDCVTVLSKEEELPTPSGPDQVSLQAAVPNPFNPVTRITYYVPADMRAQLTIYNVRGEHVTTLVNRMVAAGDHVATWDAAGVPSGLYFYRLTAGDFSETRKMVLLK